MENYEVAFDILASGHKAWFFPAFGAIFIFLGIAMLVARYKIFPSDVKMNLRQRLFPFAWLGFSALWTATAFQSTYGEYTYLIDSVTKGYVEIIEGNVENFDSRASNGKSEKFCVKNTCFQYSDYSVSSGFNNSAAHGGPIREGLPVRITHVGDTIVKLEILR